MVIVDASIAYKWYSSEKELSVQALKLYKSHLDRTEVLCAPSLLLLELANAWVTKTQLPKKQAHSNLKSLESVGIVFEELNFELITKVIDFADKYHVTAYDAMYAVLAQEKGCDLLTADSKFVAKVNLPFVKHLSEYSSNIN